MLVVECRKPNSAEQELIESVKTLDGILFVGYQVIQENREREIDAILFTPVRAVAIEVKGTFQKGELEPRPNSSWQIGSEPADFYGGSNPNHQAKINAQILATFMRNKLEKTPFVQVAIAISGDGVTMHDGPTMSGQTAVSLTKDIVIGLEQMKKKQISYEMILEIIDSMDLAEVRPKQEDVKREWRNEKLLQKHADQFNVVVKKIQKKESIKNETPLFKFLNIVSEYMNIFIVVFLFVWFLYSIGVLSGVIHIMDSIQVLFDNNLDSSTG